MWLRYVLLFAMPVHAAIGRSATCAATAIAMSYTPAARRTHVPAHPTAQASMQRHA
ncbi:hypothetical protein XCR_4520 [Xanthomonas campestris pv. raphani 756C]|nr:hypothetical protein XCR_4520 [Xanthomonas campestris pv. raphani 756C]